MLYRISSLAVLLVAVLYGAAWIADDATHQYPLRTPVTPQVLRDRGSLRFAITHTSVDRFSRPSESSEFDYDLLRQFATDLRLTLIERAVDSDDESARLLRAGMVDLAVLPPGFSTADDLLPARPCPSWIKQQNQDSSRPRLFAWADSPELVGLMNAAAVRLAAAEQDNGLYAIYCYGAAPSGIAHRVLADSAPIDRYAGVIAKYADAAGLDWRLVAALIYEESSFKEHAVSPAGARGLMQLMPETSAELGVTNISAPEANIRAGVQYLRRLAEQFPSARAKDRLALVLGSYLLGPAHLFDAQDLASERGMNPQIWEGNVEQTLPLLEDPSIQTRAGVAQGRHAVAYVNRILERYETYRRHLESEPELRAEVASDNEAG